MSTRAAMILCAGLGTRLRPLTDVLAKPMVPIGDRPALAHVVERVRAAAERLVVNVHHRPGDVRGWAEPEGIAVSFEPELLGTAGGVAAAGPLLGDGDVLVWNGDILTELDPRALVRAHDEGGAAATLAIVRRAAGEGNVGVGRDGSIVRLRKEPIGDPSREVSGGDFLGIHVLGASFRGELPSKGCLVGDVYLPALRRGARLSAFESGVPFVDVGTIAQYLAANAAWLAQRGLSSWAHPSAHVEADVSGSVIGAGARVEAAAVRSVVWPGARVTSPVEGAVITA
ncbi:MAG: NTP transferase domain-containing protein [Deltaproteobacteria bacterium]|nr:NTP transferase domain-containing protein [Deltaproteobacteria bacterium]